MASILRFCYCCTEKCILLWKTQSVIKIHEFFLISSFSHDLETFTQVLNERCVSIKKAQVGLKDKRVLNDGSQIIGG